METRTQKAFEFAAETTKQLITLATGIITVTITFSKDFVARVPGEAKIYVEWAWFAYVLSIIFGVWALMALTGTLEPAPGEQKPLSIRGGNVRIPAVLQIFSFLMGTVLTVVFGVKAL